MYIFLPPNGYQDKPQSSLTHLSTSHFINFNILEVFIHLSRIINNLWRSLILTFQQATLNSFRHKLRFRTMRVLSGSSCRNKIRLPAVIVFKGTHNSKEIETPNVLKQGGNNLSTNLFVILQILGEIPKGIHVLALV